MSKAKQKAYPAPAVQKASILLPLKYEVLLIFVGLLKSEVLFCPN